MADSTYSPKVYKKDGGDTMVVASGGTVQFESGATLQLDAGSIATLADEILAAGDIALAEGSILVGDANGAAAAVSAKTSGRILVGDGTTVASVAVSGDATLASTGALTIANSAVTLAKMADLNANTFVGRDTESTGAPEAITAAAALTMMAGVAGVAAGYKIARGVASVTGSATVATGLTTVVAVTATAQNDLDGDTLAGVSATIGDQAGAPVAGSVVLKAWKVTTGGAAGNPTLIAADAAKSINWIAVGV